MRSMEADLAAVLHQSVLPFIKETLVFTVKYLLISQVGQIFLTYHLYFSGLK